MFDFLSALPVSSNPKEVLTRANFAVQDKLGRFMSLGSRVIALRDKSKDPVISEKAEALLEGITAIQTRALSVLAEAKTLQEKAAVSPSIGAIKSAVEIAKDLYAINADMDIQTAKVAAFEREASGLPQARSSTFPWVPILGLAAVIGVLLYMRGKRK